jgi:hypothetical protein
MTLREGLLWLMGPGAGILAWWLLRRLEASTRTWPAWIVALRTWFCGLGAEDRRYTALAFAGLLAIVAYGLVLVMTYESPPGTWREWAEALFDVAYAAVVAATVSQVAHGRVELRQRDEEQAKT